MPGVCFALNEAQKYPTMQLYRYNQQATVPKFTTQMLSICQQYITVNDVNGYVFPCFVVIVLFLYMFILMFFFGPLNFALPFVCTLLPPAILLIIFVKIYRAFNAEKYKAERLIADNIDIYMLSSSVSIIGGKIKKYEINLLFDNKNTIDKSISIRQFLRFNHLYAHSNDIKKAVSLNSKECKSTYLQNGMSKVTFFIYVKKKVVLNHLNFKNKPFAVIADNRETSV